MTNPDTELWIEAIDGGDWQVQSSLFASTIQTSPKGRGVGGTVMMPLLGTSKMDRLIALATARFGIKKQASLAKRGPSELIEVIERNRLKNLLLVPAHKGPGWSSYTGMNNDEWQALIAEREQQMTAAMFSVAEAGLPFETLMPIVIEYVNSTSFPGAAFPMHEGWSFTPPDDIVELIGENGEGAFGDSRIGSAGHGILNQYSRSYPMTAWMINEGADPQRAILTAMAFNHARGALMGNLVRHSPHKDMNHRLFVIHNFLKALDDLTGSEKGSKAQGPQSLQDMFNQENEDQLPQWARSSSTKSSSKPRSPEETELLNAWRDGLDEIEQQKDHYWRYGEGVQWQPMILSTLNQLPEIHNPEIPGLRPRPNDRGVNPRYVERWMSDRKVFGSNRFGLGGSVLFDLSGSMNLSVEDLNQLMEILPASTMACYSGTISPCGHRVGETHRAWNGKQFDIENGHLLQESPILTMKAREREDTVADVGILRVIAHKGARISTEEIEEWTMKVGSSHLCRTLIREPDGFEQEWSAHGSNGIDGPALRWLGEQRPFRIWVSDGMVTGSMDTMSRNLFGEVADSLKEFRIIRVPDVNGAIGLAKTIAKLGAGAWL